MKQELRLFFTALQFYTRFPIPAWVGYDPQLMNQATRYLPLIGYLVAILSGFTWWVGLYLIDNPAGIVLSLITSVLLTGAFHEDGFADACDGFGGGWTKEKILDIMKDSRVGTYAVVGLILLFGIKFSLLNTLSQNTSEKSLLFLLVVIAAHALSRFMAVTMIFTHQYVRFTNDSKAKPVAETGSTRTLVIAGIFGLAPVVVITWLTKQPLVLLVLPASYAIKQMLAAYFKKWIGGYTGDCLGATQQVCEVGFYIFMAVIWKFI